MRTMMLIIGLVSMLFLMGCVGEACPSQSNSFVSLIYAVKLGKMEIGRDGGIAQEWSLEVINNEDCWVGLNLGALFRTDKGEVVRVGEVSVIMQPNERRVIPCPKVETKQPFMAISGSPFLISKKYVTPAWACE